MSEFYYGQVIEYVDGTRDLYFEEARRWAKANNAHFVEQESFERDVTVEETYEEEVIHEAIYDDEGNLVQEEWSELVEKTREVVKQELVRPFKIVEMTLEEKQEEVRQTRASLYEQKKDPITCQIQALRDEEQTDEVVAEIENLKAERAAVVAEIKEQNPYPVEPIEKIEELPVEGNSVAEVIVSEMEMTEE